MLQYVRRAYARIFIFGTAAERRASNSSGTSPRPRSSRHGRKRLLHERLRGDRLRPVLAGVRQGQRRLPDQRQLADRRSARRRSARTSASSCCRRRGQAARDARRRRPAVGDQLEVEERRRGGHVPRTSSRRNASMQVVTNAGQLTATKAKVKVPAGLDTEVYNAWTKANSTRRDRPVPRLGDADDVRHDHRGDPGADGGQDDAGGVRRRRSSPTTRSSTRVAAEPTETAGAPRPPRRCGSRQARRVADARPPGEPRHVAYLYLLPALASTPRSCSRRSGTRSGSRCTSGTG